MSFRAFGVCEPMIHQNIPIVPARDILESTIPCLLEQLAGCLAPLAAKAPDADLCGLVREQGLNCVHEVGVGREAFGTLDPHGHGHGTLNVAGGELVGGADIQVGVVILHEGVRLVAGR